MAPIMHCGHSRIQRLGGCQPGTVIHVFGRHIRAVACHRRKISMRLLVAREAAEQRVPHVQCVSIKPGSTIMSSATMTCTPGAPISRPTATISPFRTCTDPPGISPSDVSMVMRCALRMINSALGRISAGGRRTPSGFCAPSARRDEGRVDAALKPASPLRKLRLHISHMLTPPLIRFRPARSNHLRMAGPNRILRFWRTRSR